MLTSEMNMSVLNFFLSASDGIDLQIHSIFTELISVKQITVERFWRSVLGLRI